MISMTSVEEVCDNNEGPSNQTESTEHSSRLQMGFQVSNIKEDCLCWRTSRCNIPLTCLPSFKEIHRRQDSGVPPCRP